MILWSLSEKIRMRWLLRRFYRIDVRGADGSPPTDRASDANHESINRSLVSVPGHPAARALHAKAELCAIR